MLVSRISEINNFTSTEKPIGWLVREKFNDEGKAIGLEMGCYLKDDVFISVPIHFSLKNKLIPMNGYGEGTHFKYYAIPTDMQLAVSRHINKKGKECPILVAPNKDRGLNPTFIACIAKDIAAPEVIIDATLGDGAEVVRKYVDKDRSVIGIIAFKSDTGVINPSINITINTGVIDTNTLNVCDYTFKTIAPSTVSDTISTKYNIKTRFINLPTFLDNKQEEKTDKPDNKNYTRRKKFFNKKRDNVKTTDVDNNKFEKDAAMDN